MRRRRKKTLLAPLARNRYNAGLTENPTGNGEYTAFPDTVNRNLRAVVAGLIYQRRQ